MTCCQAAALLVVFLRALPHSLFSPEQYATLVAAPTLPTPNDIAREIRALPKPEHALLGALVTFLRQVFARVYNQYCLRCCDGAATSFELN
jgi:hypothetical protein